MMLQRDPIAGRSERGWTELLGTTRPRFWASPPEFPIGDSGDQVLERGGGSALTDAAPRSAWNNRAIIIACALSAGTNKWSSEAARLRERNWDHITTANVFNATAYS